MHLIEYDLDENSNIDDYPKRKVLWETMLGRNEFCINVKLFKWMVQRNGLSIGDIETGNQVYDLLMPIILGDPLDAFCSFAYENNAEIEKKAE